MEDSLTNANRHPGRPSPAWWEAPGSLRTFLLLLDGQVGAKVSVEKHVVDAAVVSDELARQLERIAQQMGLGAGNAAIEQSDRVFGFEPVKPFFTRETGSIRRQAPPYSARGPRE